MQSLFRMVVRGQYIYFQLHSEFRKVIAELSILSREFGKFSGTSDRRIAHMKVGHSM
jgi:hypothetical protein